MSDPLGYYQRAANAAPRPTTEGGESGYFSTPGTTLDPALFEGTNLRSDVQSRIVQPLYAWLAGRGLKGMPMWLFMWLAGSGISYQWAAARDPGDLDVMLGADLVSFRQYNPEFDGFSAEEIAASLDTALKTELWPKTAHTRFGDSEYEVTYYLNPGVGHDITVIHPYAAYEIYPGMRWVIEPPELPADPRTLYPQEWFGRADEDASRARKLAAQFNASMDAVNRAPIGSPQWHNAGADLHMTVSQASALFDAIHTGRRAAFEGSGQGYGDWANFRWQRGKELGTIKAMRDIMDVGKNAQAAEETELYGAPIDSAEVALRRAVAVHRQNPLAR